MPVRRVGVPAAEALRVYDECGGNISETARRLGKDRGLTRRLIRKLQAGAQSLPQVTSAQEYIKFEGFLPQILSQLESDLREALKAQAFRDKVEELWREDSDRLMSEVTRLHDAAR